MLKFEFVQKSNFDFMQNSNECFMQNSNECYLISIAWLLPRQHSLGDDPGNGPGNLRCMHPEATKSLTLRSSEQAASHTKSPLRTLRGAHSFLFLFCCRAGVREAFGASGPEANEPRPKAEDR